MEASHDPFKWGVSFFLLLLLLLSRCVYWNYIPFWWARCIDADALFFSFFLSQPTGLAHTEELAPQTICAMCRPSLVVLPLPHGAFYIFDGDFWIRLRTKVVSNVAAKKNYKVNDYYRTEFFPIFLFHEISIVVKCLALRWKGNVCHISRELFPYCKDVEVGNTQRLHLERRRRVFIAKWMRRVFSRWWNTRPPSAYYWAAVFRFWLFHLFAPWWTDDDSKLIITHVYTHTS